ncbi:hypothetical protein GN956_G3082 [Arapaima gigas]
MFPIKGQRGGVCCQADRNSTSRVSDRPQGSTHQAPKVKPQSVLLRVELHLSPTCSSSLQCEQQRTADAWHRGAHPAVSL